MAPELAQLVSPPFLAVLRHSKPAAVLNSTSQQQGPTALLYSTAQQQWSIGLLNISHHAAAQSMGQMTNDKWFQKCTPG